jgi:hypothetical protein
VGIDIRWGRMTKFVVIFRIWLLRQQLHWIHKSNNKKELWLQQYYKILRRSKISIRTFEKHFHIRVKIRNKQFKIPCLSDLSTESSIDNNLPRQFGVVPAEHHAERVKWLHPSYHRNNIAQCEKIQPKYLCHMSESKKPQGL